MKKSILVMFIAMMMIGLEILSPLIGVVNAEDKTNDPNVGNIFELEFFKVNGVEVEEGDIITVDDNTIVELEYLWELPADHGLVDGDWIEIDIPGSFTSAVPITNSLLVTYEGSLLDIGVYLFDTTTNKLRFTFNSNVENKVIEDGFVGLSLDFDLTYFDENVTQTIPFNDKVNKEFTITLTPETLSDSISKTGVPNSYTDASYIDWTIDVLNTEITDITDGVLVDNIPEGLSLVESSIVLKPLIMGLDGHVSVVDEVIAIDPSNISNVNQLLTINMDTLTPYSGYQLAYRTTFEDLESLSFSNRAVFSHGGADDIEAVATVSNLVRSAWIEKTGREINKNKIEWTIDVNKAGNELDDASVQDVLDEDITVLAETITIYKISLVGGVWVTQGNPVFVDQTSFPLELGALAADEAYRITYTTEFDYDGDYSRNNVINNEATLFDGELAVGIDDADVTINRLPILRKRSTSNLSVDNKTITWTVNINQAKHDLTGVVFTDTIPPGLSYKANSLKITNENNEDVTSSFTVNTSVNPIEVDFGDINQTTYKIVYVTDITDFSVGKEFVNGAGLTGVGIDGSETTTSTVKPADNSFTKSFQSIDYANKTMTWRLEVNPIKEDITSLKITDTFPNNGLILLETGFTVTVGGNELTRNTNFTLNPITSNYNNGFVVELDASALPLDDKLVIVYSTSFDPESGIIENTNPGRIYINSAKFEWTTATYTTIQTDDRTANQTLRLDAWNTGKKIGRRVYENNNELVNGWVSGSDRLIEWEVFTNYLQQELGTGVVISDTLGYEGIIDSSSIRVRKYSVAANGETTILEESIPFTQTISNDDKTLTIEFDSAFEYSDRYVISFVTSVPNLSAASYNNEASVTLDDDTSFPYEATVSYSNYDEFISKSEASNRTGSNAYVDEEINWEVVLNESLSTLSGTIFADTMSIGLVLIEDSIEVIELIGGVETEVPASSYDVSIVNNSLEADVATELTITFDSAYVMSTEHVIRYKSVVVVDEGTITNDADFSGDTVETVSVSTPQLTARQLSYVGGVSSPSRASIKIIKKDSVTQEAMDSEFELYYEINGEEKIVSDTGFTTENGEYTLDNLSYRTYFLREISAPQGYTRIKDPIEIVLNPSVLNQERVLEVEVENIETLTLEKEAVIQDEKEFYHGINEVIYYTLTATNTGEETLTEVLITDDKEGLFNITFDIVDALGDVVSEDVVNGDVTLEPTQSLVMRAEYLITQEDADIQVVNNDASVIGFDENNEELSAEDSAEVEGRYQPEITLEKQASVMVNLTQSKESIGEENIIEEVGEWIAYSIIATNTGNITLHMVEITDDKTGLVEVTYYLLNSDNEVIRLTTNGETTLKPGEKLLMSAKYQVTQDDINQGDVINNATVISYPDDPTNPGNPKDDEPIEDEDDATVPSEQVSELTLAKSSSSIETTDSLGKEIEYTFVATNTGNTTLANVVIEDDLVDNLEYVALNGVAVDPELESFVLNSGDVLVARASYIITQQDIDRGSVRNQALTKGDDINEEPVEDEDEVTTPLLQVKKLGVSKTSVLKDSQGQVKEYFSSLDDVINYTIVVHNQGNTTASNVTIIESMKNDLEDIEYTLYDAEGLVKAVMNDSEFKDIVLLPNEKIVLTATYGIQQKDLDKGSVENVVRVTAEDDDGEILGDEEEFNEVGGLFTLNITKVDEEDASIVLSGAVFTVTNSDASETWTVTTDVLGQATVEGLVAGTYYVVETTAPEGYTLSEETVEVIVGGEQSLITVTLTNAKEIILPDTSDSGYVGLGSSLLLILGGLLLIITRKTKVTY